MSSPIIDFHAHVGEGARKSFRAEELLRLMDARGIERCVICPVEEYMAVRNREGNDYILKAVSAHSDRLSGMAVASPWYGHEGVRELQRALEQGMSGLKIHSVVQGFMLCDPIIFPLLEAIERRGLPVYVHTGSMNNALPFQLLELAERFPNIPFIMGHMGYSDFWYDTIPIMRQASNIYAETSHALPDSVAGVIEALGADRLLFGSDSPESTVETELAKLRMLNLPEGRMRAVLGGNARKLLRLQ